jgi:hypothetical protein
MDSFWGNVFAIVDVSVVANEAESAVVKDDGMALDVEPESDKMSPPAWEVTVHHCHHQEQQQG